MGSALAALAAWASVRSRGGTFILRIEDLDPPRAVEEAPGRQMEDLAWLGLDWDEGPRVPSPRNAAQPDTDKGPHPPYRQSERSTVYEAALARLATDGHLFPCRVSRKDLQEVASAPHGHSGLPPYPPRLRPTDLPKDWFARYCENDPDAALRLRVPDETVTWTDRVLGPQAENVRASTGDFVLKRRDGLYAYQLAVVADDMAMGVTEVVRGQDLVGSTARQILLIRALGGSIPGHAHVPLLRAASGEKLSKRDSALSVRALRKRGASRNVLIGYLAHLLGQTDSPTSLPPMDLADHFDWNRVPAIAPPLPEDLPDRLVML